MKFQTIILSVVALVAPMTVIAKPQDYAGSFSKKAGTPNISVPTNPYTTTIKKREAASDNCFASSLGFPCCSKGIPVTYSDGAGDWGVENDEWCGIGGEKQDELCNGTFACCKGCDIMYTDKSGKWGIENGKWCYVKEEMCEGDSAVTCTGMSEGYECCDTCDVLYTNEDGRWGKKDNKWCGIKSTCKEE